MMSATASVYALVALVSGSRWIRVRSGGDVAAARGRRARGLRSAIQTFYAGARRIGAAKRRLVATVEPPIIVGCVADPGPDAGPDQLAGAALIVWR